MLDLNAEHIISLTEAATTLPRRRRGSKPHVATLYRWALTGCRGVKLETIQIGGTKCTSREALQRFFERLSNPAKNTTPAEPTTAHDRAARELDKAGW